MKRVHDRMAKIPHLIGRIQKVRHHNGNHPSGVGRSNTIVRVLKNKAARGIFRENFCTPEEWSWMRLAPSLLGRVVVKRVQISPSIQC